MKWGCSPWGESWGGDLVENLRSYDLATDPPSALIMWDKVSTAPDELAYQVYIDGVFYDQTTATELLVTPPGGVGVFDFEVFGVSPNNANKDLTSCLTPIVGDRIKLSWVADKPWGTFEWGTQQWGKTAPATYKVYWDEGLGGSFSLLGETSNTEFVTDTLEDGTYKFRVDPVDAAGNQRTSTVIETFVLSRPPTPPSEFRVTAFDPAHLLVDSPGEDLEIDDAPDVLLLG